MADDLTTLRDAIAQMQTAQTILAEAITALGEHNNDLEAHPQIRDMINAITSGDALFTRDQIIALIVEQLKQHTDKDFKTAHGGWAEFETDLREELDKMASDISGIQNRLDGEDAVEEETNLAKILQEIEDNYAPILAKNLEALQLAKEQGNDFLAEQLEQVIAEIMEQKKQEQIEAMREWNSSHESGGDAATLLIGFDANGGTGTIDAVTIKAGEDYVLPACTFIPPTDYAFVRWNNQPDGLGGFGGIAGSIMDTKGLTDAVTLYAIWAPYSGPTDPDDDEDEETPPPVTEPEEPTVPPEEGEEKPTTPEPEPTPKPEPDPEPSGPEEGDGEKPDTDGSGEENGEGTDETAPPPSGETDTDEKEDSTPEKEETESTK